MIDISSFPKQIKTLEVNTPHAQAGKLIFENGSYSFVYDGQDSPKVSVTMNPQHQLIYNSGALFPIFEMNIPEGFVRRYIAERLQRYVGSVNDMMFLALQQDTGIGGLSYHCNLNLPKPSAENLEDLLHWNDKSSAFEYLLNKYLFQTSISGVQPKVMVSAKSKGSLLYPNLIAKTGDAEFPQLPENEYLCMTMAKACGLPVPRFYLSDNKELFIMERFDIDGGKRLGMEDFCVLSGRTNEHKYMGSYEMGAKIVNSFTQDQSQVELYWQYVLFSCMVGNGDAHLKNFALLYDSDSSDKLRLSPLYDVVNTLIYPTNDNQLALKLNKSKEFPNRDSLLKFAKELNIIKPEQTIEKMADIINDHLSNNELWDGLAPLKSSIAQTLSRTSATNNVFVKLDAKRTKKRKTDRLL